MKRAWKIGWRVLVCIVLLGWIFHAIFLNEAKAAAGQRGINWESLSRSFVWVLSAVLLGENSPDLRERMLRSIRPAAPADTPSDPAEGVPEA